MPKPNPFLLIAMLFWGYNFVSLKVLNQVMPPGAVIFWRYFVMGAMLVTICIAKGISLVPPAEHRTRIWLAGCFSLGIYMVFFMEGVKRSAAGESAIMLATNPIMVAVMAMWLKMEPKSIQKLVGGVIALVGVACVVLGRPGALNGESHLLGDLLLLLSAFAWAVSIILAKPVSKDVSALPLFTMSMLGGLPVVFLYGVLPITGAPALNVHWSELEFRHWANFVQVCLGSGVVAMVFYYRGVEELDASSAAMHQFLVPVLATGFAAYFLNERLDPVQGIGLIVLITGLYLVFKRQIELPLNIKK